MSEASIRFAPPYFVASANLSDTEDMDITPATNDKLDSLVINAIHHENDGDVKVLVDSNGDGTYNRNVTFDSVSGNGVLVGHEIQLTAAGMRFRFTDTSGESDNDVIVTGEVDRGL